jgi:prepilin-type N-terminal cleavage/methylation domain-containing protein
VIPPSSTDDFECLNEPGKTPGPFGGQIYLYVDDGGLPEIVVTLSGAVAAPPA